MRNAVVATSLILSAPAFAEDYCVNSESELLSALTSAAASPEPSVVRIARGVYEFTAPGSTPVISITDDSELTVVGGWNADCSDLDVNPEQTVLRTVGQRPVMEISRQGSDPDMFLSNVSFRNGASSTINKAGCLTIFGAATSALELTYLSFRGCTGTSNQSPAALFVLASESNVLVRTATFANNVSANGAIELRALGSGSVHLLNNTIAFNSRSSGNGTAGLALFTSGGGSLRLTNTVAYSNGGPNDSDVFFEGSPVGVLSHNIIGRSNGIPASMVASNNIDANPLFASNLSLRSTENSPMRDTGDNAAVGGLGLWDIEGRRRLQGIRVDRGAHEFDDMFSNGFE